MRRTHKATAALAALSLGMTLGFGTTGGVSAQEACTGALDVDGDGLADTPVGAPGEDIGKVRDAGSVTILRGAAGGKVTGAKAMSITQEKIGQKSRAGDNMGASVAVLHWNPGTDLCADLAIGIPGKDGGRGIVVVVLGSPSGLDLSKRIVLRQGANGAADTAEAGDRFGQSMDAGGQSATGTDFSLVVGVPGEDIGAATDAGAVMTFSLSLSGPSPVFSRAGVLVRQGAGGVSDVPETGDGFGSAVSFGGAGFSQVLAIGVPGEDIAGKKDAGAVHQMDTDGVTQTAFVHQNVPRVGGTNQAGDRFGSAISWVPSCLGPQMTPVMAIGVPGKDLGGASNTGAIVLHEVEESPVADRIYFQGPANGFVDAAEAGDAMGSTLATTRSELLIGVPAEDIGKKVDAGMVIVVRFGCTGEPFSGNLGLVSARAVHQNSKGVGDTAEKNDRFGASIGVTGWADFSGNTIVVGSPGESVGKVRGAGSVTVFSANPYAALGAGAVITQNSQGVPDTAETGDGFGSGLAVSAV
jgi:hypothetical protein